MMTLNASFTRRWYYRLRGRRHIRGRRWEKSAKGKKNPTLSPQTPSVFPFLPISYPFRRLLRRLWYCNFNFPWLKKKKKKSVSFPRPRFFPDYFWTCGNDVTNSIKSINSCISIISLCQSARRPFPTFTAFKCALILRLLRFPNKQLARRLYQPFLLRSINISNTERRQFQFQFNSTFNETTRWRTKARL